MSAHTTVAQFRQNLESVLDQVSADRETIIVRRRGGHDVALVPAEELAGLLETAHLLRSPKNARRLMTALERAQRGKGKPESPRAVFREAGLE
jgi:antitoxin YefM